MTDQEFKFGNLDTDSAIIVQRAIELRKIDITSTAEFAKMSEKEINGRLSELDQMNDDLDRHIASNVRTEHYKTEAKRAEVNPLGK